MANRAGTTTPPWRHGLLLAGFAVVACVLLWRAVELQVEQGDFLRDQAESRHLRTLPIPAHRGMITDRNGEPLAVSAPVETVWANPRDLPADPRRLEPLAEALGLDAGGLAERVADYRGRQFMYVRRHVSPDMAARVRELGIPGVHLQREYRRFYPGGEVCAQLIGLTNIDGVGQEGLELAFDDWLSGTPGKKRVIKDLRGGIVENVEQLREPEPGRDLVLSIDRGLQYLAYRELKKAVRERGARAGSAVLLDADTGEVLAMVNQPSFNPNRRDEIRPEATRNRAIIDTFEPGSTMKPFTVATALASGAYDPHTPVDTHPGYIWVDGYTIKDHRNYGQLDVTGVIKKSSNVGATRIAMSMEPEQLWRTLSAVGIGEAVGSGFPGEAAGRLRHFSQWYRADFAAHSYGYGMSVTLLQLARAYGVIAADGQRRPVSLLRLDEPPAGRQVIPAATARSLRKILQAVIEPGGTGTRAAVAGYSVAGKTGTVHKPGAGGYEEDSYTAVFAGMAPMDDPRFVLAVMVDEPKTEEYSGGRVAAPVFSRIMAGALRLMSVPPERVPDLQMAMQGLEEHS